MHVPEWVKSAIFYEIYPQSFCDSNGDGIGDFPGMTSKLDYLCSLGINAVWINPCFASPFMDAGYDISDYYTIAPRYGTNDDAIAFFREAHKRGIRVLLDLVPGHTSDRHPWFLESRKAQKNAFSNRYIWTNDAFDYPAGFRLQSGLSDRNGNYVVNFFSSQPALNYGFENPEYDWQLPPSHPDCQATVNEIKKVIRFWLDAGCDGFRVDMAYSLVKNDPLFAGTKRLWQDIRNMLERDYPHAVLLSEWSCAENAIDAGFHMDFYIHFNCIGYNALFQTQFQNYVDEGKAVSCFFSQDGKGNILDFTREFSSKLEYISDRGFMCIPTGNHDMIRYSNTRSVEDLKLISAFVLLLPCVPFIYYGDEIGMRYQGELVSKEGGYFRTGSRTPMQWNDGVNKGFSTADTLYLPVDDLEDAPNCAQQMADPDSLYNSIRRFIQLRRNTPDFQADGSFEIVYARENKYPFVFRRGKYLVAVNPSAKAVSIPLPGCGNKIAAANGDGTWENGWLSLSAVSLVVFE